MTETVRSKTPNSANPPSLVTGKVALIASFVIPTVVVVGILLLLLSLRDGAEMAMNNLANLLPVGYAFGAGMVASVNPCGFFLLPSYISYHLASKVFLSTIFCR